MVTQGFDLLIATVITLPTLWIQSRKLIPISYMKTRLICVSYVYANLHFDWGFEISTIFSFHSLDPSRDSWHCERGYMFCFCGYIKSFNYSCWSFWSKNNHTHTHNVIKEQALRKVSLWHWLWTWQMFSHTETIMDTGNVMKFVSTLYVY